MKIKYDYQIFGSQEYGGISKYHYYLASGLFNRGIKVEVVAPFYINKFLCSDKNRFVKGISINLPSKYLVRMFRYINMFFDYLLSFNKNYDIVHKTYYSIVTGSKKHRNVKNILTIHDMNYELYPQYFKNSQKFSDIRKKNLFEADHIISVSNTTKNDLIRIFGISPNKISVVYHGVDKKIFFKNKTDNLLKQKYGEYLLYVGKRNGYKNFRTLLELFSKDIDLKSKYKLILFGGEEISNKEKFFINSHQLQDKIIKIDGDDRDLSKYYGSAAIFIYTSIYEGFGLPIIEAMACGCPVIAVDTEITREIAMDGASLISNPFDQNEISKLISKISIDEKYKNNLINNGYKNVEKFEWSKCTYETQKIYERILKE